MAVTNEIGSRTFSTRGLSTQAKSAGYRIERRVVGHAYPRNGNTHNPTPEIRFTLFDAAGQRIDGSSRYRDMVEAAHNIIAGKS